MRCHWWGPACYDWMLAATEARGLADRRRRLVASARGRVLEIGAGSGLNLRHYRPDRVDALLALEPDPGMRARLAWRAETTTVPLEVRGVAVDDADLPEGGFDTIVVTLTLCCVPDPAATAAAIATWLVPGGRLLLIEHVAALGMRGALQRAATPMWSRVAHGCHLDRPTLTTLRQAGLSVSDCQRFALPGAGPLFASCVQAVAWRLPIGEPDPEMSVLAPGPSRDGASRDGSSRDGASRDGVVPTFGTKMRHDVGGGS
ncbi:MAG: class I SAM-dependent methyltransferase [Actinomycetota bacterium]|nr:class I SAM-dependent methyltransferase [Actinomycetota bacterium]